ncbi:MAG: helix-turn-helix domain-containing protein [Acidobacteria bacterium]|nr:helix-turn-helix domain-containing protein [Acidobacteriota bacterium]
MNSPALGVFIPDVDEPRKSSLLVAKTLRERRLQLGFSLRQVSREAARHGQVIPAPTLQKIEAGKADPGLLRLRALVKIYNLSFDYVAELLELEAAGTDVPSGVALDQLLRDGIAAFQKGDVAKGLSCVLGVRYASVGAADRLVRQKAMLSFAIMVRQMGMLTLSLRLTEELLREGPRPEVLVNVLIHAAAVWHELGCVEAALAFADRAAVHLHGDDRAWGWVHGQRAHCLAQLGETDGALEAANKAIEHFVRAADVQHQAKYRLLIARLRHRAGEHEQALSSAKDVLAMAERERYRIMEAEAWLLIGEIEQVRGGAAAAQSSIQKAFAIAVDLDDRELRFCCHYRLWKLAEVLGQLERARMEREAALYFVGFVESGSPEAAEARECRVDGDREARQRACSSGGAGRSIGPGIR